MHTVSGSLLGSSDLIVHQENCIRARPCGLAGSILRQRPDPNYDLADRKAGTVYINEATKVVTLFGQVLPGRPGQRKNDDVDSRIRYFGEGLRDLAQKMRAMGVTRVSFPHGIGCGLARGDWNTYERMISLFELEHGFQVTIYKL